MVFYLRMPIFNFFANFFQFAIKPVFLLGRGTGMGFSAFINSQKDLTQKIIDLETELAGLEASLAGYQVILNENISYQEILNRKDPGDELVLANILAKPIQNPYDTLLLDSGFNQGIEVGDMVLVSGNIPVGRIDLVSSSSSRAVLFSAPEEKTEVVISTHNIFLEAVGRGRGNFELIMPRDIELANGEPVMLPGSGNRVVGLVAGKISDPRDAFNKILLTTPVNVEMLKFVQVKIN